MTSTTARLDALEAQAERIEAMLRELTLSDTVQEVRARRIVVVDEDGFERIVLGTGPSYGEVAVRGRTHAGDGRAVTLVAQDDSGTTATGGDLNYAGVFLTARGNHVGSFEVTDDAAGPADATVQMERHELGETSGGLHRLRAEVGVEGLAFNGRVAAS